MIVASDLMGTLTTGSPFLGLVDWVKHNQSKLQANLHMAAIMPSYVLAKNGMIDWQAWGQKLMVNSLGYIKNADPEKLAQASEWVVEHDFWKNAAKMWWHVSSNTANRAQKFILPAAWWSLSLNHSQDASVRKPSARQWKLSTGGYKWSAS
ncbi:hypothetical protein [Candidatus Villigracilis proximus]|uniref:hypothetical protein n=1 Tax=Candidatus Villigracilis proximus TaxID=3140683 RepID=UPI0031ECDEE6